jgi:hypothetical protein
MVKAKGDMGGRGNGFQIKGKTTSNASNKTNEQGRSASMAIIEDRFVWLEELIINMVAKKLEEKVTNIKFHKCAYIFGIRSCFMIFLWSMIC